MKTITAVFFLGSLGMLLGCQEPTQTAIQHHDKAAYDSATYVPENQYKTHQLATFVEPTDQASLSFQVSGVIEEQLVEIGDPVEIGQALFKVSNPSLAPQIQQFNSQIEAIDATLEQNQVELSRVKSLQATQAISKNELDRLNNERSNLLATKQSLVAQLDQAQSMFDETLLKAPFAGTIAEIYQATGTVISPGEPILLVGGVASLEAPVFLPAFLHQGLTKGQILEATYAEHSLKVTVKEISLSANPQSQLFNVMLEVPVEHQIKSGEKITVLIQEALGQFHRLPIESVIDDGINQPFVFLIKHQQVIRSPIKLIGIEGDEVIVSMAENDAIEVVISGQVNLSPNQTLGQP